LNNHQAIFIFTTAPVSPPPHQTDEELGKDRTAGRAFAVIARFAPVSCLRDSLVCSE
jgi:hypothetical protein